MLHSVLRGVSLWQPVTYVTVTNKEKNENESLSYIKKTFNHLIIQLSYVVCKLDA